MAVVGVTHAAPEEECLHLQNHNHELLTKVEDLELARIDGQISFVMHQGGSLFLLMKLGRHLMAYLEPMGKGLDGQISRAKIMAES